MNLNTDLVFDFNLLEVILTKELFTKIKPGKILTEIEWRGLGVKGSKVYYFL